MPDVYTQGYTAQREDGDQGATCDVLPKDGAAGCASGLGLRGAQAVPATQEPRERVLRSMCSFDPEVHPDPAENTPVIVSPIIFTKSYFLTLRCVLVSLNPSNLVHSDRGAQWSLLEAPYFIIIILNL